MLKDNKKQNEQNEITIGVQLSLKEIELILKTMKHVPGAVWSKDLEKLQEDLAASKGALQRAMR